jgi:HD-like signal output (HDOD) protein
LSDRAANALKIPADPAFFSVGLLHDIGKVVLDFLYPDQYLDAITLARQSETPLHETERAVFGLDHAEAGGLLAERWNLPVTLVEAIRLHHATDTVPAPPRLAALGAVADYLAHEAGFGEGPSEMPPPYPRTSATALGMDDAVWRPIVDAFVSAQDRVDALLVATAA